MLKSCAIDHDVLMYMMNKFIQTCKELSHNESSSSLPLRSQQALFYWYRGAYSWAILDRCLLLVTSRCLSAGQMTGSVSNVIYI